MAGGRSRKTSARAPSWSVPVGRPSGSRSIRPSIGSRVSGADPGPLERRRVDPGRVAVAAVEIDRPVGDDPIEVLAPGHPAREVGHRPAIALDPRFVGVRGGVRGDDLEVAIEPTDAVEATAQERQTGADRVDVGVAEAGRDRPAAQLDDPRPRSDRASRPPCRRRPPRSGRRGRRWRSPRSAAGPSSGSGRPTGRGRLGGTIVGGHGGEDGTDAARPSRPSRPSRRRSVATLRRVASAGDHRPPAPRRLRQRARRQQRRPRPRRRRADRGRPRDGRPALADPRPAGGARRRAGGRHPRLPEPPPPGPHGQHRAVPERRGRRLLGALSRRPVARPRRRRPPPRHRTASCG